MQAIVLAAGFGTRLWPLTADRAKPAVPFLGKPLVRHMVEHLRAHGIGRVVVNTHYRPESVAEALDGLDVACSHEDEILGTAGALALARDRGLLDPNEPVLIANGKLFTDLDVGRLAAAHESSGAAVTMALRTNAAREHFREVLVEDDRIVGFGEGRIPAGERPLAFTGLHVVSPRVLARTEARFSDTIRDVYPSFIEGGEVRSVLLDDGRWWELSTLERYHQLHVRAATEGLAPDVSKSATATIEAGADVERAVLWEGARVESGATVRDAVLGANVVVRSKEVVTGAVLVHRSVLEPDGEAPRGASDGDRWRVPLAAT